jgi:purine-binding chemotaxis protein CheW
MWLLCRIGAPLCALPLDRVVEVMRPLPIEPLAGTPPFVRGMCIVRGLPVPVIDTGLVLSGRGIRVERFVIVKVGDRPIALAVEQVVGVRPIEAESLNALPPLLQNAAGDAVGTIRALDGELLLLLDTMRIIPEALLDELSADAPA